MFILFIFALKDASLKIWLASGVDGSQLADESSILRWIEPSSRIVPLQFAFLDTFIRTANQPYQ